MELKDYIAGWEKELKEDEERPNPLSELYAHFKKGTFTPEQVLEFYRVRDTPRFIEAVKLFEKGKLFQAQMQSYESWERHDYAREDKIAAEAYLSVEDSAQMKKAEGTPANIRRFIFMRVYGSRPRGDDMSEKAQKIKDKWIFENKKYNWRWNN